MTYHFDPAAEAASARSSSRRDYSQARRLAKQAAEQYEWARKHSRHLNAPWLDNSAEQERLVRALIRLADTLLSSSFHATDRAREYAARARRYEAEAAEQHERYVTALRAEAEAQTEPCLWSEGKVASRGQCYCASCRLDLAELSTEQLGTTVRAVA